MRNVSLRIPYTYDTNVVSKESALECKDGSKTQQHAKEETDINTIVRRFGLTGQLPTNLRVPVYGDFTDIVDYQTALNQVIAAQQNFMSLPAEIRKRFANDPQQFLEFCSNEDNLDEMRKMGLAVPAKPKNEPAAEGATATEGGGNPGPTT